MLKKNKKRPMKNLKSAAGIILLFWLVGYVLADSSTHASFSVEIKEWLVLQVTTPGVFQTRTGNEQTLVLSEVVSGQPVEIKALLSVASGKTVVLKGMIVARESGVSESEILEWTGSGDLSGHGLVTLNQETVFAAWAERGMKEGSLIFKRPGGREDAQERWQAIFVLTSL